MKEYDVLVIGGSAAGVPAVHTVRRHYPELSVALIRKEEKVLLSLFGIMSFFNRLFGKMVVASSLILIKGAI